MAMSQAMFECLEGRVFLSAAAAGSVEAMSTTAQMSATPVLRADAPRVAAETATDETGTMFSGVLKLRKKDDAGRRLYVLNVKIDAQATDGSLSGTVSGPEFGNATFTDGRFTPSSKGGRQ